MNRKLIDANLQPTVKLVLRQPCARGRDDEHLFTGGGGVVTWLVGLVGGDTALLLGAGVVLLLTDAEGLLLSGGIRKEEQQKKEIGFGLVPASVSDSESSSSSSSLEQLDSSFLPSSPSSTFSGSKFFQVSKNIFVCYIESCLALRERNKTKVI
ncbi:hypothetical protein EYF80_033552 [Liparis tanakae]|uniref:Uncharacterized protein n=1 Tax=Liparis tanakae TaxID=230148 RepID=A0A4Z2GS97_9TELE|nr:hypothetical protein EYF80_033552 [Liparis tanakae]